MHPNKIVLTKETDEDVGDQWHPANAKVDDEIIGRYKRISRDKGKHLEAYYDGTGVVIWLEPTCHDCVQQDRHWCDHDAWGHCLQCGHKSIPYLLEEP